MKMDLSLYLVTARYQETEEEFLAKVSQACENGVTLVQLREKELTTRNFYQLAQKVKKITDSFQIPLIINDRVDICLAVDAAGVHIGDDELPVAVTRQLIGPKKILGVSSKTVAAALAAASDGADYLGVGAIFPTKTKVTPQTPLGTLKKITETVEIPVVAIGGIKADNLTTFKNTGVKGVAVVSEIMKNPDPAAKTRELKKILKGVLSDD